MFRIRRIYDDALPINKSVIREVQAIWAENFPAVNRAEIDALPEKLHNPFKQRFRSVLYVAEKHRKHVAGFALVMYDPVLHFCFLDYLASAKRIVGRGIGAALYEFVRDEALALKAVAMFFECLPDDPADCADPVIRKENAARLRFYEQYGVRPIVGTAYETPLRPGDDCVPHLMFDDLDQGKPLSRGFARKVVRAILERKYADLCPPEYVEAVVKSFKDDPIRLRDYRYLKQEQPHRRAGSSIPERIALVVSDQHELHHIKERGYVEAPVRVRVIRKELQASGLFEELPIRSFPEKHILSVHDRDFVDYLRRACAGVPEGKSVYPYVFPIRNAARPPKELSVRAGYYCIDTFTPLNQNAFTAAKRAVDCTLTAADEVLNGRRLAYVLVRPPGHHAERRVFGGFCYFCNAAIAAQFLLPHAKVAILDLDYHHGNGQQEIFYDSREVLTVSIHGSPDFAYPYFSGFSDERGAGDAVGYNVNYPLPELQNGEQYRRILERALEDVRKFDPDVLIVALGLDPAKGDPTGTWTLLPRDFHANGKLVGNLGLPTLVIQEGGYRTRTLGTNARQFFEGLFAGAHTT